MAIFSVLNSFFQPSESFENSNKILCNKIEYSVNRMNDESLLSSTFWLNSRPNNLNFFITQNSTHPSSSRSKTIYVKSVIQMNAWIDSPPNLSIQNWIRVHFSFDWRHISIFRIYWPYERSTYQNNEHIQNICNLKINIVIHIQSNFIIIFSIISNIYFCNPLTQHT